MSSNLHKQIYNSLKLKDTDELVEIWQTNDRVEWSQTAFDVLQEILQERLGELPPQDEPILEYTDDNEDEDINTDFDFQIDDENLPEFYDPYEVLRLERWLYKATIAAIIAFAVSSLIALPQTKGIVLSYFMGNPEWNFVAWVIAIVVFIFGVALQSIIIYFPLKALGSILKILMEMEFHSRGAAKAKKA
jgi:hypothetical protein